MGRPQYFQRCRLLSPTPRLAKGVDFTIFLQILSFLDLPMRLLNSDPKTERQKRGAAFQKCWKKDNNFPRKFSAKQQSKDCRKPRMFSFFKILQHWSMTLEQMQSPYDFWNSNMYLFWTVEDSVLLHECPETYYCSTFFLSEIKLIFLRTISLVRIIGLFKNYQRFIRWKCNCWKASGYLFRLIDYSFI